MLPNLVIQARVRDAQALAVGHTQQAANSLSTFYIFQRLPRLVGELGIFWLSILMPLFLVEAQCYQRIMKLIQCDFISIVLSLYEWHLLSAFDVLEVK